MNESVFFHLGLKRHRLGLLVVAQPVNRYGLDDVRPGITGLAQVNGRTSITWEEKIGYDLEYVKKMSFLLDVKILFLTAYQVLKRENVGVEESGKTGFYLYREAQWAAEGRQDLIEKAREESLPYRLFKNEKKR